MGWRHCNQQLNVLCYLLSSLFYFIGMCLPVNSELIWHRNKVCVHLGTKENVITWSFQQRLMCQKNKTGNFSDLKIHTLLLTIVEINAFSFSNISKTLNANQNTKLHFGEIEVICIWWTDQIFVLSVIYLIQILNPFTISTSVFLT